MDAGDDNNKNDIAYASRTGFAAGAALGLSAAGWKVELCADGDAQAVRVFRIDEIGNPSDVMTWNFRNVDDFLSFTAFAGVVLDTQHAIVRAGIIKG